MVTSFLAAYLCTKAKSDQGMEELTEMMTNPFDGLKEDDRDGFQRKCSMIAEKLFRNYCLNCNGIDYFLAELEFYYYDKDRFFAKWNTCTYPRTNKNACDLFFHESGLDICFNSDFSKGAFGGILIRSLIRKTNDGATAYITGPLVCAKEIINACSAIHSLPTIKRLSLRDCIIETTKRYGISDDPDDLNLCYYDVRITDHLTNKFENESWDYKKKLPKNITRYYSKRFSK